MRVCACWRACPTYRQGDSPHWPLFLRTEQDALNQTDEWDADPERLFTAEEVAGLIGVSPRTVPALPIRRIRVGPRLVRFRLRDVYAYLGLDPQAF